MLIDGENLLHRSFHKFANLKTKDGKNTGAIFGFFKSLHYLVTRFAPDRVMVTFDNGHSPIRTNLLPGYKGHRKNISMDYQSLQKQKKVIRKILRYLNIPYVFDKEKTTPYEGDDFLAWLTFHFKEHKVLIVSSDKDFNQLITKDVTIFNPNKDERVLQRNCKELFGYTPEETVDYLSLIGDSSDDIPGFKGIGPVKARQFLDKFGTIENSFGTGFWKNEKEAEEIWVRNKTLISLEHFLKTVSLLPKELPLHHTSKGIDMVKYTNICIKYSLNSFRTEMFLKPFKELKYEPIFD